MSPTAQSKDKLTNDHSIDLSIIIVSYNTCKVTKNCIESVLKSMETSTLTYEIVLVDNNSQDGSVAMIQQYNRQYDQLFTLLLNSDNRGFGAANNQGLRKAKGEYVLLLNSDTVVLDRAITTLYDFAQSNPNKHFLGAKLLNADMSAQDSAGPNYSLPVVFVHLLMFGDRWPLWRITRFSPNTIKKVGWVSGACILTKRDYLIKLDGFDEQIFMYMEEIDLLYRAQKNDQTIYFYPQARFIHLGSASSKSANKRTDPILQVYRGLLYYYKKHHSHLDQVVLKSMLQFKSLAGILIGRLSRNTYLIKTYEQARQLVTTY